MSLFLWVFLGGFLGTIVRYFIELSVGIFLINMVGSFFIGFIYSLTESMKVKKVLRTFVIIGFLGGMTTVSHWIELIGLDFRWDHFMWALFQIIIVPILGVIFCYLGINIGVKKSKSLR